MIFISRISYSIYLIIFIVFFYFSGTLKSSEEFHLSSYLDRVETFIVLLTAVIFTLSIDMPTQNIIKLLLNVKASSSKQEMNHNGASDDFESPFGTEEEEVYVFRPVKNKYEFNENTNGE
jgi:peptidoglycan/LPS O-acetylase OafA/YrhL